MGPMGHSICVFRRNTPQDKPNTGQVQPQSKTTVNLETTSALTLIQRYHLQIQKLIPYFLQPFILTLKVQCVKLVMSINAFKNKNQPMYSSKYLLN